MALSATTAGVVAASVLATVLAAQAVHPERFLDTAHELSDRAETLTLDTAERMTPAIELLDATGKIQGSDGVIDALNLTVRAFAPSVDLRHLAVHLADGTRDRWLRYAPTGGAGSFGATAVRDADGSLPRMTKGDLVVLDLDLAKAANDFGLPTRATFQVQLVPEQGSPVERVLRTPLSFGDGRVFPLD
jgi:archaellin